MRRQVSIPFPEGLNGDYASACGAPDAVVPPGATAPDATASAEAARAFRTSLMRLPAPRDAAEAANAPDHAAPSRRAA